jgi:hypothetical protein
MAILSFGTWPFTKTPFLVLYRNLAVPRRISARGAAGEDARFSLARPFRLSSGGTGAIHFMGRDGVDIFRC